MWTSHLQQRQFCTALENSWPFQKVVLGQLESHMRFIWTCRYNSYNTDPINTSFSRDIVPVWRSFEWIWRQLSLLSHSYVLVTLAEFQRSLNCSWCDMTSKTLSVTLTFISIGHDLPVSFRTQNQSEHIIWADLIRTMISCVSTALLLIRLSVHFLGNTISRRHVLKL